MAIAHVITLGFGGYATGSVTPATIAVSDNADGTGGVATISGSQGGTVTVYAISQGGTSAVSQGTRSGDGTLSLPLANGLYTFFAQEAGVNSNVVVRSFTGGGASGATKATYEVILQAVVNKLIADIAELETANCYMSIDPNFVTNNPGRFCCTVSPASGRFNDALIDGGGVEQITAETALVVKIHSTDQRDQSNRSNNMLVNSSTGLLVILTKVLKALSIFTPESGGQKLTRNPLIPGEFAFSQSTSGKQRPRSYSAVEVTFHIDFDWNIA